MAYPRDVFAIDRAKRSSLGFTLIELLVVVGIIGLLAGLIVPAIRSAAQKGHSTNCQSNIRQLLIATHLYEEANGFLPAITGAGNGSGRLIATLQPHVDNYKVFHCPAHRGRGGEESGAVSGQTTCYKYNDNTDTAFFQGQPLDSATLSTSSLVLLIDSLDGAPRHFGGVNLGFADGHVEWLPQNRYDGSSASRDPIKGTQAAWYLWGKKP